MSGVQVIYCLRITVDGQNFLWPQIVLQRVQSDLSKI